MSFITKSCLYCEKHFDAPKREVNRGNGKFCSKTCSVRYYNENKPKKESNVKCAYCGVDFYLCDSKKRNSKSGLYFCCRAHKDTAQKIGGVQAIMPAHYGTAQPDDSSHYRRIAFSAKPQECERCGYNHNPIAIIVHHKDRNRQNDDPSNLEVLCAICHIIEHHSSSGE